MPSVLIVGGGGRAHALADAFSRSAEQPHIIVSPGNGGIVAPWSVAAAGNVDEWVELARTRSIDLVVVGPEAPLVAGLGDRLREEGIPVVGPNAAAAELEGSKTYAKSVMAEAGVPTARWASFDEPGPAIDFARSLPEVVVKADGLAGGKGVVVADSVAEAQAAIVANFDGAYGEAGRRVVVEERLRGEEVSVIALTDGEAVAVLAPSQDHKRLRDGDQGPNTGGMGAYSPAPVATPALLAQVETACLRPTLQTLNRHGRPFSGILYAGIMVTASGPKVLEYNVRFGDPEAQAVLPRLQTDAYALFSSVARGRLDPGTVAFDSRAALTVVMAAEGYPGSPKTDDRIEGLEEAASNPDVRIYHAGTRREGDAVFTAGGRVLAVTGLGDDLRDAAARAYDAVGKIHWAGVHYRQDIGFRALGASSAS